MKELKIASAVFITVSVICFVISGVYFVRTRGFIKTSIQAEGTVVDFSQKSTSSGSYYSPIVHFYTENEKKIILHSKTGSNRPGFKTGEKVKVFYNPDDPREAIIATFFQLWGVVFILVCVALGTGLIGAGFVFMASRFRGK